MFIANEDSTEHETALQGLDRRWQILYKQIIACERETEKILFLSTFEEEFYALTKAREEYQTWIETHASTSSTAEIQVRYLIDYRFIREFSDRSNSDNDDDKTSINIDYMIGASFSCSICLHLHTKTLDIVIFFNRLS